MALTLFVMLTAAGCPFFRREGPPADEEPQVATFVGSERCKTCHGDIYEGWAKTLHPKMLQDVDKEGAVVADFEKNEAFKADEADYTVGSKWRQQFLVREGDHFFILPKQWIVETEEWADYHPDDWKKPERAWDTNCAGCHTTGFDPEELTWVDPGVGCEACHGPGSLHVAGGGDPDQIFGSVDSQVCGACHTRGKTPDGKFGFPIDYRPGDDLSDVFEPVEVKAGENTDAFWGNAMSRQNRQQYLDWTRSDHATALGTLTENDHAQDFCLNCHSADYRLAEEDAKPTLDTAKFSVTCVVCHTTHGNGKESPQLRLKREEICTTCHNGGLREEKFPAGEAIHHGQKELFLGIGGYGVEDAPSFHQQAGVTCVDCHMVKVATSAVPYDISNHTFKVILPREGMQYEMPDSCTVCHKGASQENRQAIIDGWQDEIMSTLDEIKPRLTDAQQRWKQAEEAGKDVSQAKELYNKAFTNVSLVESDRSLGVHNIGYARALLAEAESFLDQFDQVLPE